MKKNNALYVYPHTDCIGFHHSYLLHTSLLGPVNYLYYQKDTRATTNCVKCRWEDKIDNNVPFSRIILSNGVGCC